MSFSSSNMCLVFLILAISSLMVNASADENENSKTSFSIYFDNDVLNELLKLDSLADLNDDRDYTMGLEFSLSGKKYIGWLGFKQMNCILDFFTSRLKLVPSAKDGLLNHSIHLGDTAFTPNDISSKEIILNDRPYANLFYLSVDEMWIDDNEESRAVSNRLIFGALGLDIGKAFQTSLHRCIDSARPNGWDHQISEGGEFTFLLSHKDMRILISRSADYWFKPEVSYQWDINAGYYCDVGSNCLVRWGRIRSAFYTHASNPLTLVNHRQLDESKEWELYLFANTGMRIVGYNSLLQGQFRKSDVTIESSNIERFLLEGTAGVAFKCIKCKFTLAYNVRSSEIGEGLGHRTHVFGGIFFQYLF